MVPSVRSGCALVIACGLVLGPAVASGQSSLTFIQWFETEWDDIERRTPDMFIAGYNALWLPPPSKASFQSPGYDPFDRFDLGKPPINATNATRARTTYGTEQSFGAMIDELKRANAQIYIDGIFNHNSGRTTSDFFLSQGGWPGFWIPRENPPRDKFATDNWGDFHNGNAQGFLQSENPGAPNYDLYNGDLVALIDIAQESNNQFIRQPVAEGNPLNIPAGTLYNRPDPNNARFYQDQSLTPTAVSNPGTSRNPGTSNFTRYPFNLETPLSGDAVTDNTTGLLMRWAQWMMEVQRIDGFRLDASKHTPPWFWDTFFDSAVHMTRTDPWGNKVTPFTFGESVTGNFDNIANYIRKDSFANRDSLDLQGAARLREIVNANGLGSWSGLFSNGDNGHLDIADNGVTDGTLGVNHVFSHDNGTVGNGSSLPPLPTAKQQGYPQHAYLLMRPGPAIVYHHGRGVPRSGGFFPREGVPIALGLNPSNNTLDSTITRLVQLRSQLAYGQYFQLNANISDVLVFERAANGLANCVVAVNDRYDAGVDSVQVTTQYPQGTRLHEQTGNASDPVVDPNNQIPQTITVGAGGVITIAVPRNVSSTGVEHAKGFVIYSEALPSGNLVITNQSGVIPADPTSFPAFFRRLNPIPVVSGETFRITLNTSQTDILDPNTDDNALFRINSGTRDYNGNGIIDIAPTNPVLGGYEQFVTINQPTFGSGGTTGVYSQEINTADLDEGFNYVSVIAFRQRANPATSPIFTQWRTAVYVDRLDAELEVPGLEAPLDNPNFEFRILNSDRTVTSVHTFLDLAPGTDPVPLANSFNAATRYDRLEWRRAFDAPIADGQHVLTVVAFEHSGSATVIEVPFVMGECPADFNADGEADFFDIVAFLGAFAAMDPAADFNNDTQFDFFDIAAFLGVFSVGCP